jgi:hypothetical protein
LGDYIFARFWLDFLLQKLLAVQNSNSHRDVSPENIADPFIDYCSLICYSLQSVVSCDVTTLNILNPFSPQQYDPGNDTLLEEVYVQN